MKPKARLHVGDIAELSIDTLAFGGEGVGRIDSLVIFVPFSAPQDHLRVEITEVKKNFARARIQQILTPSPSRTSPQCSVFGQCGGCHWQHINYAAQAHFKAQILRSYFKKHLKINPDLVKETLPSPESWRYRNRIQVRVQNQDVGYFAQGSNEIVAITDCPIADQHLTSQFSLLRERFHNVNRMVKVELALNPFDNQVLLSVDQPHGNEVGFSQVNTNQNKNLVQLVLGLLPKPTQRFVDLYCGAGNFLLPALTQMSVDSEVVGVELSSAAMGRLRERLKSKPSPLPQLFEMDVADFVRQHLSLLKNAVVLLDPPRIGCENVVLQCLKPEQLEKIVYVSCNPTTFARDAQVLLDFGWTLNSVYPVDMFPQTYHLELVAEFQKR